MSPVKLSGSPHLPAPTGAAARPDAEPALSRAVRDWLPVAWASGCSLWLVRLLAAYWLLVRATRRCATAQAAMLAEAVEAARRRLGIRQHVQVRLDARRTVPMVWGVWRPHLLLPAEALVWDDGQLRSVLLHELAHVKRRDLAVQCLLQAACALHWFNPLVWLAAWRVRAEGERACDDLVLASGVRASEYAEHVLRVATQFAPTHGAQTAGLAMARPSRLEGRLVAVLNERLNRRGLTRTLAWLALAAGLCVVVPVAMLRGAEDRQPGRGAGDSSATAPKTQVMPLAKADARQVAQTITNLYPSGGAGTASLVTVNVDASRNAVVVSAGAADLKRIAELIKQLDTGQVAQVEETRDSTLTETQAELLRVRLQKAKRDLERASKLRQQNTISELEFLKAQSEVARLQAELNGDRAEAARIRLRQAESELQHLTQLSAAKAVSAQEVEQARLNVDRLKAKATGDPAQRAQAEVEVAQATLASAQVQFKRISELFDKKLVSEEERDQAEEELGEARVRLAEAQSRRPGVPQAELDSNRAEAARIRLRQAESELKRLTQLTAAQAVSAQEVEQARLNVERLKKERVLQLLADEIQVAEGLAKVTRRKYDSGNATLDTYQQAEMDVLALKRKRADLEGDTARTQELIGQQIRLFQDLEQVTRQRREAGTGSEADVLRVRRQLLALQREQAELE